MCVSRLESLENGVNHLILKCFQELQQMMSQIEAYSVGHMECYSTRYCIIAKAYIVDCEMLRTNECIEINTL